VNILLIHQAFASLDEPGGTRHHELARRLADRGHSITIIASPISYLTGAARSRLPWLQRQQDGERITILRAYTYPALHRSFVHRVFSFLSFMFSSFAIGLGVRRVDLVWGTSPPLFQGAAAWALARLKRTPFLFEVRDLWPAFAIAVGVLRNSLLIRLSEWLERFLYRRADALVVNSPGFIEHVRSRGARRIELIPNGADPEMFSSQPGAGPAFRQSHGLPAGFIALYAGAHGLSNDLNTLLDAAALLRDRADITIVLLGDGKEKPALQQRAADLGLDNLRFLPPVPKSEMPAALAAANACIAILKPIELYKTTYPNKIFDYMAAGRPVALAIDGVVRQVVEEAGGGLPIPPGDAPALAAAIRALADDPQAAQAMGQRGRAYLAAHFDRAALADQLADLLQSLVTPLPPKPPT
jgi:glycosyltransferase involved in cell wall biosynthesis